jgi:hypothetical protein
MNTDSHIAIARCARSATIYLASATDNLTCGDGQPSEDTAEKGWLMARPEREIHPSNGPVARFALELRQLRTQAGEPTYLKMARLTGRSRTALAEAAGGDHLATWETVHAYVKACGGDLGAWRRRWQEVRDELDQPTAVEEGDQGRPGADPPNVGRDADIDPRSATPSDSPQPAAPMPLAPQAAPEESASEGTHHRPGELADAQPASRERRMGQRLRTLPRSTTAVAGVLGVSVIATGWVLAQRQAVDARPRPAAVITVQNKYAAGKDVLTEDSTPAYLSTKTVTGCRKRGCVVAGTDNLWSGVLLTATCQARGEVFTNADLNSEGISSNPGAATSTLWYFVEMPDGEQGYLPEVYVVVEQRGGMGLPACTASAG